MTTPREPRGSSGYGRDPYEPDPYGPDPHEAEPGAWGRPPAGGWGEQTPRREEYGGEYGSQRDYGWPQPEYAPAPHLPRSEQPARGPSRSGPPRRGARARPRPPWVPVAAAAVVVVAVLVLGFVTPGWFVTRVLDPAAVQTGIAKVLGEDYAIEGVADVRCPEGVQVTSGATFTCAATIDGDPVTVPVRLTDGRGGYEVGRPT